MRTLFASSFDNRMMWPIEWAAVAMGYYVLAIISQWIVLPPGNVSLVFLPAGFALALTVYGGYRRLPGIFFGSALYNLLFIHQNFEALTVTDWVNCLVISSGASLQAFAGAWAIQKIRSYTQTWGPYGQTFSNILLGGVAACTINASMGTVALYASHLISEGSILETWSGWWFGDIMGVALAFMFLSAQDYCRNKKASNALFEYNRWHVLSYIALAACLLGTFAGWAIARRNIILENQNHFENLITDAEHKINQRLRAYEDTLWGGVGLFKASQKVSRQEWAQYIQSLHLTQRYPGMLGMGYIQAVQHKSLAVYVNDIRQDHAPNFQYHTVPNGQTTNADHFIIQYIEPLWKNQKALGLDIGSEPNRREAAELSRDRGQPYITNIITLVQDNERLPGFLLLLPFYKGDSEPSSISERRKHFLGWVYAPFVGKHLLQDILAKEQREIEFNLYDGEPKPEHAIFIGHQPSRVRSKYTAQRSLPFAGRIWTLEWYSTPNLKQTHEHLLPLYVMVTGLVLTVLIGSILLLLNRSRDHAMQLVQQATQDLEHALKKAEQQSDAMSQYAQKANAATAAKSEFLANMSHEIRTPMNSILGFTELTLDTLLTEQQTDYIQSVHSSARLMLTLINDILDFSKVEAGKITLESVPFSLPNCLNEIQQLFELKAAEKSLQFTLDIEPDVPEFLIGDPLRLKQILNNLISNAIKFTESGFIQVHVALLSKDEQQAKLAFTVKDSGKGIPEDKLSEIFEAFSQEDSSTSREYGGTGLGLSISAKLAQLLQGDITVQSTLGEGSTFLFTAMMGYTQNKPIVAQAKPLLSNEKPLMSQDPRVLLVEDNELNQKIACRFLEKLGCRHIVLAHDGQDALDKLAETPVDIIFMDCQMPHMSGYEATRKIREQEHGSEQHIPIVAMTANAMQGDQERCQQAGMDDYLSKPLDLEKLRSILEKYTTSQSLVVGQFDCFFE